MTGANFELNYLSYISKSIFKILVLLNKGQKFLCTLYIVHAPEPKKMTKIKWVQYCGTPCTN